MSKNQKWVFLKSRTRKSTIQCFICLVSLIFFTWWLLYFLAKTYSPASSTVLCIFFFPTRFLNNTKLYRNTLRAAPPNVLKKEISYSFGLPFLIRYHLKLYAGTSLCTRKKRQPFQKPAWLSRAQYSRCALRLLSGLSLHHCLCWWGLSCLFWRGRSMFLSLSRYAPSLSRKKNNISQWEKEKGAEAGVCLVSRKDFSLANTIHNTSGVPLSALRTHLHLCKHQFIQQYAGAQDPKATVPYGNSKFLSVVSAVCERVSLCALKVLSQTDYTANEFGCVPALAIVCHYINLFSQSECSLKAGIYIVLHVTFTCNNKQLKIFKWLTYRTLYGNLLWA